MDSYDQLAIRACKGLYSERLLNRLRKIYGKRCSLPTDYIHNKDLLWWLLRILGETQVKFDVFDLIWDAAPFNRWKWGAHNASDHFELFLHVVASRIRLMEVKHIPGYRSPRKWRGVDRK
jgi:hypothetical protein